MRIPESCITRPLTLFRQGIRGMDWLESRPPSKEYLRPWSCFLLLLNRVFSLPIQGTSSEHLVSCIAYPVALGQRAQPMIFLDCRKKLVASADKSIQDTLFLPDLGPHTTSHAGLIPLSSKVKASETTLPLLTSITSLKNGP